jgi:hypothetical protein
MRRVSDVDSRVWEQLVAVLSQPREALLARIAGRRGAAKVEDAAWAADLEDWERRRARLVDVERDLGERYAAGLISAEAMDDLLRRLTRQRQALQDQIAAARAARASLGATAASAEATLGILAALRERLPHATLDQRRRLLRELVPAGLTLRADGRVVGVVRPLGAVSEISGAGSAPPCSSVGPCGDRLAQGRDKTIAYLAEHPDVAQEIRLTLLENAKAECQMAPAAATLPVLAIPPAPTGLAGADTRPQALA